MSFFVLFCFVFQSVSSMYYFFLFMTLNPDVQAKAQAEIDKVVGPNRLPNLSDRKNLPYVTALVSEVFRCGIVTPGALPHKLDRDDTYNGYFFPKDSLVAPNIW
jgi:cytochrome P450